MKLSRVWRSVMQAAIWAVGGIALCASAEVFYGGETKGFPGDPVNLTVNAFTVDAVAPVGLVDLDPGVVVGIDPLPILAAQQFEVLAIPEPSNWLFLLAGLAVLALAVPRCRRVQGSFRARRAAVRRASRRWAGLPRRVPLR